MEYEFTVIAPVERARPARRGSSSALAQILLRRAARGLSVSARSARRGLRRRPRRSPPRAVAADSTDPKVKITKADQARAAAAVLRFSDLGPAWSGRAEKPKSLKIPICPANQPNN